MPMTCVFSMKVEAFAGNPFKAQTPFGQPVVVSKGDIAHEAALLREERDHWLQFVSSADKAQFPFNPEQ